MVSGLEVSHVIVEHGIDTIKGFFFFGGGGGKEKEIGRIFFTIF